jgi:hypothetical protein
VKITNDEQRRASTRSMNDQGKQPLANLAI